MIEISELEMVHSDAEFSPWNFILSLKRWTIKCASMLSNVSSIGAEFFPVYKFISILFSSLFKFKPAHTMMHMLNGLLKVTINWIFFFVPATYFPPLYLFELSIAKTLKRRLNVESLISVINYTLCAVSCCVLCSLSWALKSFPAEYSDVM